MGMEVGGPLARAELEVSSPARERQVGASTMCVGSLARLYAATVKLNV